MTSGSYAAHEQLHVVGLEHKDGHLAGGLPIGERKKLEVARALATKPELLLLDEVMGGLNPAESEEIIQLILALKRRGLTQMVIEHDMKAIMRISDRIVVLNSGEKLTEVTSCVWPGRARISFPVCESHSRAELSWLPVKTREPSGEKATDVIAAVCPARVIGFSLVPMFQIRAVSSALPVMTR